MTNTQHLLTRAKDQCDPPTWYQLGKRTGIAHTTLSRCMKRGGTLDNEGAIRLAEFLHLPKLDVVALIELDRATTDEKRNFWEKYAPRVLPAIVAATIVGGLTGGQVEAAGMRQNALDTVYIMRTLRRWWDRARGGPQNPLQARAIKNGFPGWKVPARHWLEMALARNWRHWWPAHPAHSDTRY